MSMAVAIAVGVLVGLSLGALGAGGSILTVPALIYLLGQQPAQATTGSLIIVGAGALAGAVAQRWSGNLQVAQGVIFSVVGVAGSWFGVRLASGVDPRVLLVSFAALMLVVATVMLLRLSRRATTGEDGATACTITFHPFRVKCSRLPLVLVTASGVGLLTGFFGVGGGFVVVPALALALGFSMPMAVATSLVVIAGNSLIALGMRIHAGIEIDWPIILSFAVAAMAGSALGGRVGGRVRPRTLTIAFVAALLAVAGYMLVTNLPQLL